MVNTFELLRRKGLAGIRRSVAIRLRRLLHWSLALPLYGLHRLVGVLASPWLRLEFGLFPTERVGHLALNPEVYARKQRAAEPRAAEAPRRTLFIAGEPANRQLLRMWQRVFCIYRLPGLHALMRTSEALWRRSPHYVSMDMLSNEYQEFEAAPPSLTFTEDELRRGREGLAALGIDADRDWYVCVFARDSAYLNTVYPGAGDWSYHDNRNADINDFNPAIEEIVRRGGFVVRMGYHVTEPLRLESARVVDYARHHRSDFMDIYLTAHCRLFLGTTSGIGDLAMIFDRPRVGVDWVPFGNAPFGKNALFIPKLIASAETGVLFGFKQLLEDFSDRADPKVWDGRLALRQGYRFLDNTPQEILAITREMLARLDGEYRESQEVAGLRKRYRELVPTHHWCAGIATPVGGDFLLAHADLLETP